ncbi:MAG: 50S ribosomal protein L11 methyltransferase [Rhodospirillales bacterium]
MTTVRADNIPSVRRCRIVVTTSLVAAASVEAVLEAFGQAILTEPAVTGRDEIRITAFARDHPDRAELSVALATAAVSAGVPPPLAEIEPEPVRDWLALNRDSFRPFRLDRFLISETSDTITAPAGTVHLRIDAGLAFGSGRHASTAGCLLALSDPLLRRWIGSTYSPSGRPIVDLGCGSGILAIAAAKLWHWPVLAVDVDRVAASITSNNARRNGVGALVRAVTANATNHSVIRDLRPFRLVLANILARPLRKMALAISRVCQRRSVLVLAGFLEEDATAVAAVYIGYGFRRLKKITIDGWSTLVLVRH